MKSGAAPDWPDTAPLDRMPAPREDRSVSASRPKRATDAKPSAPAPDFAAYIAAPRPDRKATQGIGVDAGDNHNR